jgi:hypothetical protein
VLLPIGADDQRYACRLVDVVAADVCEPIRAVEHAGVRDVRAA